MITEKELEMLNKLGLTANDVKTNVSDKERIDAVEEAIAELCEIIFNEGNNNG